MLCSSSAATCGSDPQPDRPGGCPPALRGEGKRRSPLSRPAGGGGEGRADAPYLTASSVPGSRSHFTAKSHWSRCRPRRPQPRQRRRGAAPLRRPVRPGPSPSGPRPRSRDASHPHADSRASGRGGRGQTSRGGRWPAPPLAGIGRTPAGGAGPGCCARPPAVRSRPPRGSRASGEGVRAVTGLWGPYFLHGRKRQLVPGWP